MKITLQVDGHGELSLDCDAAGIRARIASVRAAAKAALDAHPNAPTVAARIVDTGGNELLSFRLPVIAVDEIKQVFDRGTWSDGERPDHM